MFPARATKKKSNKTENVLDTLAPFSYKKALRFEELHLKTVYQKTSKKFLETLAAFGANNAARSQNPTERRK